MKREYPNKNNNVCPRCIYERVEVGKHPCRNCCYLIRKSYLETHRRKWDKVKKEYVDVSKDSW